MSKKQENRPVVVGDTVTRRPTTFDGEGGAKLMRGTVVFVHPKGRFHVVEFAHGIRESFYGGMLMEGKL